MTENNGIPELKVSHNPNPKSLYILIALEKLYKRTGNGIFVWRAIYVLKNRKEDYGTFSFPEWITDYLFECSAYMMNALDKLDDCSLSRILELETNGQGNAFRQGQNEFMKFYAVNSVYYLEKTMRTKDAHEQTINEIKEIFGKDIEEGTLKTWKSKNKDLLFLPTNPHSSIG